MRPPAPCASSAPMPDLQGLLAPLGGNAPSGPDLRYSPEYGELERAVEGKPERQAGGKILAAEPPDWRSIREQCLRLLGTSKDLRVALIYVRALVEGEGFAGFASGLALLLGLVRTHWATLHPQLDVHDGGDPTERVSALAALTHRNMLQALRTAPLVAHPPLPQVSLRTLEVAAATKSADAKAAPTGPAAAPGQAGAAAAGAQSQALTSAAIEGVFQQVPLEILAQTAMTLASCVSQARELADAWGELIPSAGPDFTELRRVLAQADQAVRTRLEQRRSAEAPARPREGAPGAPSGKDVEIAVALPLDRSEIRSRDDVLRALDAICAYYARSEPSSPVPLLLQRGKRLVTMSFPDILKELLPESLPSMQKISGKTD
jgi:type VI secretion system protein ImpA